MIRLLRPAQYAAAIVLLLIHNVCALNQAVPTATVVAGRLAVRSTFASLFPFLRRHISCSVPPFTVDGLVRGGKFVGDSACRVHHGKAASKS